MGNSYQRFYERTLKVDSSWSDWSLGNAVGATQGMSASVRGLQNTVSGIANDPVGALEQFANGVGYFAQYPLTTIGNGWDSLVEKGGLSQAYALQGRHELAGAVAAEQATNFGISLLPGERLLALGKVGGAKNALDGLVRHDTTLGTKGTPAWDNAVSKADGDFGYLPPVRQNYVKDVYDLQGAVDNMRASGASVEEVAKYAYSARNELKLKYRQYTPPEMLDIIDKRNLERYGNKIGPEFDDLVKKGKTFD